MVSKEEEETRKGPWTEEEDTQLVCFVGLLGERRWDFLAKVSGLHRTGKSCRLRWVNYLHPGLKRGRMSPQEERLVLELHSRWGNRWSRIARKLPGRTDNEIKNYWRTHVRRKAQERKRNTAAVASTSTGLFPSSSSPSSSSLTSAGFSRFTQTPQKDEVRTELSMTDKDKDEAECYPMEKIWDEIVGSEMSGQGPPPPLANNVTMLSSHPWDYCSATDAELWEVPMPMGSGLVGSNQFPPLERGSPRV